MIVTALLLLPIVAVLYWIYWLAVNKRLTLADKVILVAALVVMLSATGLTHYELRDWPQSIWPFVIAPMVGYGVLLLGVLLAFIVRRKSTDRQ